MMTWMSLGSLILVQDKQCSGCLLYDRPTLRTRWAFVASPQDRGMPLNVIRQLEGALINDLLQEAIFWGGVIELNTFKLDLTYWAITYSMIQYCGSPSAITTPQCIFSKVNMPHICQTWDCKDYLEVGWFMLYIASTFTEAAPIITRYDTSGSDMMQT